LIFEDFINDFEFSVLILKIDIQLINFNQKIYEFMRLFEESGNLLTNSIMLLIYLKI
jgi:hypothetical protein